MEKEVFSALLGGIVGVFGSLISVALGYILQNRSAKQQIESERSMHLEQLNLQKEQFEKQIENQNRVLDETIHRENKLRLIDLMQRDIMHYDEILQKGEIKPHSNEAQKMEKRIQEISVARAKLMRQAGLNPEIYGVRY